MSRLTPIPRAEWTPEMRAATRSEAGMMPILAQRPEIGVAVAGVYAALAAARTLDLRLLELVRLRIAFRNQCRTCMAIRYGDAIEAGLDEATICALERPLETDRFKPRELLAILYADRMANDHLSVDDAFMTRLRELFSEAELVELAVQVAMFVGFGRLTASLNIVEDLPEDYRAETDTPFAPWTHASRVVAR